MISAFVWQVMQALKRRPAPEYGKLLSRGQLKAAMPYITTANVDLYLGHVNDTLVRYHIDTPLRIVHWLAQVGHESGSFRYKEEIASGDAYDTGKLALALGNTPVEDDDGERYKGRGAIQITGKANYEAYGESLGMNLLDSPERLASDPRLYIDCAGWYWSERKLNQYADQDDVVAITRRINGGTNGLADRKTRLAIAKKALGL